MNAELLKEAAASVGECTGISCEECRDAVLRVAIEACADIASCKLIPSDLLHPTELAIRVDEWGSSIADEIRSLLD